MGSLPKLPIETRFNYRKGSVNEFSNCKYCQFYVPDHEIPGKGREPRCKMFGLKGSVRYRVNPDNRCDAQSYRMRNQE